MTDTGVGVAPSDIERIFEEFHRAHSGDAAQGGDVAIYDINARIITLAGNVQLNRGSDRLSGGRLVIDLNKSVASINGSAGGAGSALGNSGSRGGRVTGSFTVPKRD